MGFTRRCEIGLLLALISLGGCVTWSSDIPIDQLSSDAPKVLPVPRAWTHSASKLELCVVVESAYKQDVRSQSFVDSDGTTSEITVVGVHQDQRAKLGSRFYLGQNLVCFVVANDRSGSPFSAIEVSSSPGSLKISRVYWHWGHYI